jgi:hypothetical protein
MNKGQKIIWTIYILVMVFGFIDVVSSAPPENCRIYNQAINQLGEPYNLNTYEVDANCRRGYLLEVMLLGGIFAAVPAGVLHLIWNDKKGKNHKHNSSHTNTDKEDQV